jgi:hypothetical protein
METIQDVPYTGRERKTRYQLTDAIYFNDEKVKI